MPKVRESGSSSSSQKRRPALTPEARENQLISYAIDLVERRLLEGTASSQETVHFLKLGSTKAILEREREKEEIKLLKAKTESIKSQESSEELYRNAIAAMKRYGGHGDESDEC